MHIWCVLDEVNLVIRFLYLHVLLLRSMAVLLYLQDIYRDLYMLPFLPSPSLLWHLIWSAYIKSLLPTNARKRWVTEHACRYGAAEPCLFFTSFGNKMAGRRGWTVPAAGRGELVVVLAAASTVSFYVEVSHDMHALSTHVLGGPHVVAWGGRPSTRRTSPRGIGHAAAWHVDGDKEWREET